MIGKTNIKVKPNKKVNYVEYIESTGTQYIDTGIVGNQNIKIEAKFKTGNYSGGTAVLGRYVDATQSISLAINNNGSNANSRFGNAAKTLANWQTNTLYEIEINKDSLIRNGTTYTLGASNTFTTTNSLLIFHNGDANVKKFVGKLYYLEIYENGILIRDFKPCKDEAGVYCLYDKVEKKYYYNQGTGEVLGGASI